MKTCKSPELPYIRYGNIPPKRTLSLSSPRPFIRKKYIPMRLPSLSYIGNSWLNAAKRFPLPTLIAVIGTFCAMWMIESEMDLKNDETVFRLFITCFIFFPLFIASVAGKEAYNLSVQKHWLINGALLLLMVLYWNFWAPHEDFHYISVVRYFLFLITAHLIVTFTPYLKTSNINDFWEYNRRMFIHFVVGYLYSILIYAGLSFALIAVKYLFDIDFDDDLFGR